MDRFEFIEHVDTLAAKGIGYYVTHFDFRNEEQIAQLNLPAEEGGKGYSIVQGTQALSAGQALPPGHGLRHRQRRRDAGRCRRRSYAHRQLYLWSRLGHQSRPGDL